MSVYFVAFNIINLTLLRNHSESITLTVVKRRVKTDIAQYNPFMPWRCFNFIFSLSFNDIHQDAFFTCGQLLYTSN